MSCWSVGAQARPEPRKRAPSKDATAHRSSVGGKAKRVKGPPPEPAPASHLDLKHGSGTASTSRALRSAMSDCLPSALLPRSGIVPDASKMEDSKTAAASDPPIATSSGTCATDAYEGIGWGYGVVRNRRSTARVIGPPPNFTGLTLTLWGVA
jgi:hypothetical protein